MKKTLIVGILYFITNIFSQINPSVIKISIEESTWFNSTRHEFEFKNNKLVYIKKEEDFNHQKPISWADKEFNRRNKFQEKLITEVINKKNINIQKYKLDKNDSQNISINSTGEYIFFDDKLNSSNPILCVHDMKEYPLPIAEEIIYYSSDNVTSKWSPDGNYLAIPGKVSKTNEEFPYPNAIIIYDIINKNIVSKIFLYARQFYSYDWSPDSKSIAVLSFTYHRDYKPWNLILNILGMPVDHDTEYLEIFNFPNGSRKEYKLVEDMEVPFSFLMWLN
jgi:hypothetical protein